MGAKTRPAPRLTIYAPKFIHLETDREGSAYHTDHAPDAQGRSLTDDHGEDTGGLLARDLLVEVWVVQLQALEEGHVALVARPLQDVQEHTCGPARPGWAGLSVPGSAPGRVAGPRQLLQALSWPGSRCAHLHLAPPGPQLYVEVPPPRQTGWRDGVLGPVHSRAGVEAPALLGTPRLAGAGARGH